MIEIDLSPEALQRRRQIAEKATPGSWIISNFKGSDRYEVVVLENNNFIALCYLGGRGINDAAHIAANSPNALIAMIDEIKRLRHENARLQKEADWLAGEATDIACSISVCAYEDKEFCDIADIYKCKNCWREAARKAVEDQNGSN